jgi:serine/threonine protein kinase
VPSTPPRLAGFDYVQLLGSGGFADVFLYQQHLPKRRVAVKVMLAEAVAEGGVEAFAAEANLMAQLSSHPAIVSIFEASVSPDGRPYLVMEYCSKPNLQARYRRQRLSVAEALRIGIQVAGAVETSHRAGILHRDIKPANILVTEYGRPALTDFGIAGTTGGGGESAGMSIPWSPPESFAEGAPSAAQTDVWALGATVYTMLAGRSPFEKPGGKNGTVDLIDRIQRDSLPTLGRADVPDSLYRVLATAMAKKPEDRHGTALEFAWALQRIQAEMSMSVTSVDIIDESVEEQEEDEGDDGRTRVRSVVSIDPNGDSLEPLADLPFSTTDATVMRDIDHSGRPVPAVQETVARGAAHQEPPFDRTVARRSEVRFESGAPADSTQARLASTDDEPEPAIAPSRRAVWPIVALVAVGVIGGGVAIAIAAVGAGGDDLDKTETTPHVVAPVDDVVVPRQVPPVGDVTGSVDGNVATFTWDHPDAEAGDTFLWGVQVGDSAKEYTATSDTSIELPYDGEPVCIEVLLRRADGRAGAEPTVGCSP